MQDADRLDAIGAIGVARCFYVAGRMGSRLYDPGDPPASARALNDGAFALDHFGAKTVPDRRNVSDRLRAGTGGYANPDDAVVRRRVSA